MKLHDVPRNTRVRLLEDAEVPVGAPKLPRGTVVKFGHIDGMYSYCVHETLGVVHLIAWQEVEIDNELEVAVRDALRQ